VALAAPKRVPAAREPDARSGPATDSAASAPAVNPLWSGLALNGVMRAASLTVSPPGDPREREANRTADAVRAGAGAHAVRPPIRRRSLAASVPGASPAASDAGVPIDAGVRDRIEPVLGVDLSAVRVHGDQRSRHTASALSARAFTIGQHIHLGPDAHGSDLGLMAHEAAHTAQRTPAGVIHRDATTSTISPAYAAGLDDGALLFETQTVESALRTTPASDPMHQALTENLATLREAASHRHPGAS
jgi:hypothetical protein